MLVCDLHIENKIESYFKSPQLFNQHYQAALASSFAMANAFFQLGEIEESKILITSVGIWQSSIKQQLQNTVSINTPPIWLRKITNQEQQAVKQSFSIINNTNGALEYINNTYQLCLDEKIDINNLLHNEKELLVITPKATKKTYLTYG